MAGAVKFGSEILVNTTTAEDQSRPQITALPNGRFAVVWSDASTSASEQFHDVRAQVFDANGSRSAAEFLVDMIASTGTAAQNAMAIAAVPDGRFLVASYYFLSLSGQFYFSDGSPSGDKFLIHYSDLGTSSSTIGIATLADGHLVATWADRGNQLDFDVSARIVGADGSIGNAFPVANTPQSNEDQPAVTALLDGGFVVAWSNSTTDVAAQVFNSDGSRRGTAFLANTTTAYTQHEATISALTDGRFVIAWLDDGRLITDLPNDPYLHYEPDIRAQIFNADGSKWGAELLVNTSTAGDQQHASVAALGAGRFVIAWNSGANVFAQVFDADGAKSGGELLVHTTSAGRQDYPKVGGLADGRFVVTWEDGSATGGDTSGKAVRAQIFDPRENAVQVFGTPLGDDFIGTGFNDTLIGNDGDDRLAGGGGNDRLAGGAGDDMAVFTGARADYFVRTFSVGGALATIVADQSGSPVDGLDTLTGIEHLQFGNGAFNLAGAQFNHLSSIDGDRFDDVLFQNATTGQVYFARMIDGAFQTWRVATGALGTDWKAIASGNVNPEVSGGAETFVQQQSTGNIYFASLDTGAVTWGVVTTGLTSDWKLRAVADLNGDAAVDAIVQNQTTGAIYYAAMAHGAFQGWQIVRTDLGNDFLAVAAADINRDGFADVVLQLQSSGTIYYANMNNGVFSGVSVVSASLTPDWKAKAVADVTGDGFADVIVQQASTGTTYFADMKNGAFDHWGVVTANVTAAWVVQGTTDVDNDGFNDVLFQNQTNGTTYYANMGPAGFEGWGVVAGNISSDWHVV